MRRREFISLIGGVVISLPIAPRAQSESRMRRIGVLMPFTATDPEEQDETQCLSGAFNSWAGRLAETCKSITARAGATPLPLADMQGNWLPLRRT